MLYFVPAWYKQNTWNENEQQWYRRRLKSEFDETIKQITLFHRNVDVKYEILVLGYSPNFRHFLHRQGMYRASYWSCFDAIAQIHRTKMSVLSFHDIKWPKGMEFIYSPFAIVALYDGEKYAQVEFGEDGNPIFIDMFRDGKICRRNYYDDRGFVSLTVIYEDGVELHRDYLMENGIWKLRLMASDGSVIINSDNPYFDIDTGDDEYVSYKFHKMRYDSLDEVVYEVFSKYVIHTNPEDRFFVAAHQLHADVLKRALDDKNIVVTFFENRYDYSNIQQIQGLLEKAAYIITDSQKNTEIISHKLPERKLNITDIPPYDTRMDFGISQQLKVQNILVPIDGLDKENYRIIIGELASYLSINDLSRVHIFTRNAEWGYDDNIRRELTDILLSLGYCERWVEGNDSEQHVIADIDEKPDVIEPRFFVDVCVDERTISKCINEQRVILDLRGIVDVFLFITAISKGVPRISMTGDQFLENKKNGYIISEYNQIGRSLSYYLDSLENWNAALVACYEVGKRYTTDVLLEKWRKVLGIVE